MTNSGIAFIQNQHSLSIRNVAASIFHGKSNSQSQISKLAMSYFARENCYRGRKGRWYDNDLGKAKRLRAGKEE